MIADQVIASVNAVQDYQSIAVADLGQAKAQGLLVSAGDRRAGRVSSLQSPASPFFPGSRKLKNRLHASAWLWPGAGAGNSQIL